MRLLVSVRSADEVEAAIAGGADIIDAKEPGSGSLGPVSPEVLREIVERVPPQLEVSAALGDPVDPLRLRRMIKSLPILARPSRPYLKLGFAGISNLQRIRTLLQAACAAAENLPDPARIIAVAYGDSELAGTASPERICRIAAEVRAAGVLVDTHTKASGHLFDWMLPGRLRQLFADARSQGLLTAVAGGLGTEQLETALWTGPDAIGFRGAACSGGRMGRVSEPRVRALRQRLGAAASAFIQAVV
jgi:(5-formylfuran-3-yl)methyl phosphate synthase